MPQNVQEDVGHIIIFQIKHCMNRLVVQGVKK